MMESAASPRNFFVMESETVWMVQMKRAVVSFACYCQKSEHWDKSEKLQKFNSRLHFQTPILLKQRCLSFLHPQRLVSLLQLCVQVHHSASLKISCVMVNKTVLMDMMKRTVLSNVKTQVTLKISMRRQ